MKFNDLMHIVQTIIMSVILYDVLATRDVLASSFRFVSISMLWVYDLYTFFILSARGSTLNKIILALPRQQLRDVGPVLIYC